MLKFYEARKNLLLLLLLLVGTSTWAQEVRVSGRVTSADDGSPLPGVNIAEKGTSNGTITDANGNYGLAVKSGSTLIFSFVGYTSQEVVIGDRISIDISLETDVMSLSEIVVVGYGQQEKKDVTGSIVSVSTKEFNKGVMTDPQDLFTGRVAGVSVISNGGAPGAGSTIRIRGGASLNANNDPLIIIDGFPVDNNSVSGIANPLASINPNDIETFTVLKDASATAIYGSRASNGVIIITTKRGKEGAFKLNYNGNVSLSTPIDYIDVLNADEYRSLVTQLNADGFSGIDATAVAKLGTANTDWQKEVYRNAISQDHNIGVEGSFKSVPYRVSYGYTTQEGILKNTDIQRNSLNININPSLLAGRLNINAGLKGSVTDNNFGNTGAIGNAVAFDPTQPVRDGNTAYGGYYYWATAGGTPITVATANPVALIEQTDNRSTVNRIIGTLQVDYAIPFVEGLKVNLNTGFDYSDSEGFNNAPVEAAWSSGGPGQKNNYTGESKSNLLDLFLSYKKDIQDHRIELTGGYSYQNFERNSTSFIRNFAETTFSQSQVDENGNRVPFREAASLNTLLSFFGRANYNFGDRYLITATLRNDYSSRFSEDNRSGLFPSVAVAWRASNENFMANITSVSDLKFRAGYGVTGQQDIGPSYPYLATYTISTSTARYPFGNQFYYTYRANGYDANIKWEETVTYNAGVDLGLLKNRLTVSADFYLRETKDLLNNIPVPGGTNLTNFLTTNVGSLENRGVELSLNGKVIEKDDLNLTVGFNLTRNTNEITKLTRVTDPEDVGILVGGISGGVGNTVQNHQVGYPANSFFVFQQVYDVDGNPIEGLYVDRSGEGGSVISSDKNRYRFNSPVADYLMGINSSLTYKNIDFSFSGRVSLGNYVYNNVNSDRARLTNIYSSNGGFFNNVPRSIFETNFSNAQYLSDHYIEDASFFKMDFISAGYNFEKIFTEKLRGRVGFTVRNAFIITNYSGLDPEVSGGIDNNLYPRPRVFMLNLSLTY